MCYLLWDRLNIQHERHNLAECMECHVGKVSYYHFCARALGQKISYYKVIKRQINGVFIFAKYNLSFIDLLMIYFKFCDVK